MKNKTHNILDQIKYTSIADFQGLHDFSTLSPEQRLTWLSGVQKFLVSKQSSAEPDEETMPANVKPS